MSLAVSPNSPVAAENKMNTTEAQPLLGKRQNEISSQGKPVRVSPEHHPVAGKKEAGVPKQLPIRLPPLPACKASSTVANTLFSLSAVIQTQIAVGQQNSSNKRHREQSLSSIELFNVIPSVLLAEERAKVTPQVLVNEAGDDFYLRQQLLKGQVPSQGTIYRFLCYLHQQAYVQSLQCEVVAWIYVQRLLSACPSLTLTCTNWRSVWSVALMLSLKMYDDRSAKSIRMANCLRSIPKAQIGLMEMTVLGTIDYLLYVPPDQFSRYDVDLSSLSIELLQSTNAITCCSL